jgi:hypothetical protein
MSENKKAIAGHLNALIKVMQMHDPEHAAKSIMVQYHQLMLDKGTWFTGRKIAKDYPETQLWKKRHKPKMKECFHNSQMFVLMKDDDGFEAKYYEGFMCDGLIVVQHGFVVLGDGNVMDFTLEARDAWYKRTKTKQIERTEPIVYLGVEVPVEFLKKKVVETKMWQPYAQCYYLKYDGYFIGD